MLRTCSERGQTIGLNRDTITAPDEVVRVEKAGGVFKGTRLFRSAGWRKENLSMTRSIGITKDQKGKICSQVVPARNISIQALQRRCIIVIGMMEYGM